MHGFMIAADRSGSGKTTVTRAVMLALKNKGINVCPFKCGPDYIDPMYHSVITGVPGHNLDTFFTDERTTRELFARDLSDVSGDATAVIEGVMGIYDGVTGFRPQGSSYDLARVLDLPIILCINARGAAQTLLPIISGLLSFDDCHLIRGFFLNQVSDSFYPVLAEKIEAATGLPVIGHFPVDNDVTVGSRHLGLVEPGDIDEKQQEEKLLSLSEGRIDLERLEKISEISDVKIPSPHHTDKKVKIAIARDAAFNFFYRENELTLEDFGAEITYFSPIHDSKIPCDADGLILPGGYPELHAEELASNTSMTESIRQAREGGMPILAECGGFMYLFRSIEGQGPLVGLFDGDCINTGRSVRFGYLSAYDKAHNFVKEGESIKGHEFHYYDVTDAGHDAVAIKPYSDNKRDLGYCDENSFMSFAHFYYPSYPYFAQHFIEGAAEYASRRTI